VVEMEIILYPLATEKAVRLIEANNEILFVVNPKANKHTIKRAVEQTFKVKVDKVRIETLKNKKRAYVKLKEKFNAMDVATELGMV
jgi:ribosomal protein L23